MSTRRSSKARRFSDTSPRVIVLVDTATGWGRRLIRGVLNYAEKHGPWHLWIDSKGQNEIMHLPRGWAGDGIIARVSSQRLAREIKATKLPIINVSGILLPDVKEPRVTVDYHAIAELAVRHFLDRGFRHFAYSGVPRLAHVHRHRQAFEQTVESNGFQCHVYRAASKPRKIDQFEFQQQDLIRWLNELPKPVGIFTWATDRGREILDACRYADLAVPHDVAVLGGDYDELLCDASSPPLSGVAIPSEQIGHEAAALLDDLIHQRPIAERQILIDPTGVVERRSTDTIAIDDPDVVQALRYIRDRAFDPIQMDDILNEVPISRRSMERKFNDLLGRSPTDEIRRLRMAKVKNLLSLTDMTMPTIAEACGYGTYNYMSHLFKKETGMTPSQFRTKVSGR